MLAGIGSKVERGIDSANVAQKIREQVGANFVKVHTCKPSQSVNRIQLAKLRHTYV